MNEEEQIFYLYALDYRIAEYEEELEHLKKNTGKPLIDVFKKKIAWDAHICPLCWYRTTAWVEGTDISSFVDCEKCAAGKYEGDGFCGEFIKATENAITVEEMEELIEMLKNQRNRVIRRKPMCIY